MPDLSLKGLDERLMRSVKVAASVSGVTLREWVVNVLTQAIANKVEMGTFQTMEVRHGKVRKAGDDVQAAPVQKRGVQVRGESKGASEVAGKPEDTATVGETEKAKGAVKNCPRCGKPLVPWGNSVRCQECQINYPAEAR